LLNCNNLLGRILHFLHGVRYSVRLEGVGLCPGFTHKDVAEIVKAAGSNIAVSVARADGPGNKISLEVRKREGYIKN